MKETLEWSEYRLVLEIAEAGSLAGAGRRLALSHPTMFRRLNALEDALGVRLFERHRAGYVPTPAGEEMIAAAREIAERTTETERRIAGRDLRPAGLVRLTTTDTLLYGLLSSELARFRAEMPEIDLEIAVSNEVYSLSEREADIAIRPASRPDPHLIGRRLGVIRQAAYRRRTCCGEGRANLHIGDMAWIGPSRAMAYGELHRWMKQAGLDTSCRVRIDTVLGIYAAVRAGTGVGVLPAYIAEKDETLERAGGFIDELDIDLWLLTHPDLRKTARIRATLDFLAGSRAIRQTLDV